MPSTKWKGFAARGRNDKEDHEDLPPARWRFEQSDMQLALFQHILNAIQVDLLGGVPWRVFQDAAAFSMLGRMSHMVKDYCE
jgi:hypothetical protein